MNPYDVIMILFSVTIISFTIGRYYLRKKEYIRIVDWRPISEIDIDSLEDFYFSDGQWVSSMPDTLKFNRRGKPVFECWRSGKKELEALYFIPKTIEPPIK